MVQIEDEDKGAARGSAMIEGNLIAVDSAIGNEGGGSSQKYEYVECRVEVKRKDSEQ